MARPRRVLARRFGLGRVTTTHVRVRSQPFQTKPTSVDDHQWETEYYKQQEQQKQLLFDDEVVVKQGSRRIMVVVERNFQAKSALQWALTHAVQSEDVIVLLFVTKPNNNPNKQLGDEESDSVRDQMSPGVYKLLYSMKKMCQMERPEVQVEVAVVEGSEKGKGPAIVEETKKQGVSLLVLGQRKRSIISRLLRVWKSRKSCGSSRGGVVEYCIQNANCMTIAVRRKSGELGGYLVTTRHHKNFWLLA